MLRQVKTYRMTDNPMCKCVAYFYEDRIEFQGNLVRGHHQLGLATHTQRVTISNGTLRLFTPTDVYTLGPGSVFTLYEEALVVLEVLSDNCTFTGVADLENDQI